MSSSIEDALAAKRLRVTTPRLTVFAALKESSEPLAIGEIVKRCPKIDRVSVYRTIDLFLQLHIVERITHGWKQHYELASPFRPHHHHLSCSYCGRVIELHSEELEQLVAHIASKEGFSLQRHTFELTGICRTCKMAHKILDTK